MNLQKFAILATILFGVSLVSNLVLGYKLVGHEQVLGNTSYGNICYYSASGMSITDGEGTALACDENGHLIITN